MVTYNAGLCPMVDGSLQAPREGATIEANTLADAIRRAKEWASSLEAVDSEWLQVLHDGKCVASLKPSEF
jgi:hypothetical protein